MSETRTVAEQVALREKMARVRSFNIATTRGRAKITNDPLQRLRMNRGGQSREARRFRDLMLAYAEPLGGLKALGATDIALVHEAASKTLLSETMTAKLARGEEVDVEQAVRVGNTVSKLLRQLERRAKALDCQRQSRDAIPAPVPAATLDDEPDLTRVPSDVLERYRSLQTGVWPDDDTSSGVA